MWNHAYPMFFSLDLLLIADLFSVGIEMTTENFGWHLFLVTGRPIKTKHGNMAHWEESLQSVSDFIFSGCTPRGVRAQLSKPLHRPTFN